MNEYNFTSIFGTSRIIRVIDDSSPTNLSNVTKLSTEPCMSVPGSMVIKYKVNSHIYAVLKDSEADFALNSFLGKVVVEIEETSLEDFEGGDD